MKVALGAPVADRAWVLPRWWEYLDQQTLQPDSFHFVYSPTGDATREVLEGHRDVTISEYQEPFVPRDQRNTNRQDPTKPTNDPHAARHFSALRNQLRAMWLRTDADVFVSLDTDLLLESSTVLEQLVGTLGAGWDVASALTYLHSAGAASQCYNAGWLTVGEGFTEGWRRAEIREVEELRPPVQIDIPMAAYAMTRRVVEECEYKPHSCAEDIGFAQSLRAQNMRVAWRTDLVVRHVWSPRHLSAA